MEENEIITDITENTENTENIENSEISENIDQNTNTDTVIESENIDQNASDLAKALLTELQDQANENTEDSEETETNEETTTVDYTQQLSDIISSINCLRSDINGISESVDILENTVLDQPASIVESFSDITSFNYLVLSLYFGLLISILFFMGLKK